MKSRALLPVKWEKAPTHSPLTLVEKGTLRFVIVYDAETEDRKLSQNRRSGELAANAIADAFERTTGTRPAIVNSKSPETEKSPYVIAVGKNRFSEALGLDGSRMPREGYTLTTFDRGIVICGHDGSLIGDTYNKLDWYRYRINGTSNGAYDFCERFLGMRYYYAGIGIYAPKITELTIEPARYSDAPYFMDRYDWAVDSMFKRKFPWKGHKNNFREIEHTMRMAISTRYVSGHSPDPQAMGELFPDKRKTIFFTDKFGHFYYLPSTHIGNYFDITNPEFPKILVDCFVKFYQTDGKYRDPWKRSHAPNSEYVPFGQCDTLVENLENERTLPHIHKDIDTGKYGKYTDVYMQFWIALGREMKKRLPGKKIGFSLYHNYAMPPVEKYSDVPDNLMPKLDIGSPAFTLHPWARKRYQDLYSRWVAIFGHPINGYWYGVQTNAYSKAIQGSYMGELLRFLKPYLSRDGLMLDAGAGDYHFYYSYYPVYRALWNPDYDCHAAVDEHWELMYGPKAGKTLRAFYKIVKDTWEKKLLPSLPTVAATSVPPENLYKAYSIPVINQLEALLKQAMAETAPGSIERLRLEFFMEPWMQELSSSRGYLTHVTPVAKVSYIEEKICIDGRLDEPFWEKLPSLKLNDAFGQDKRDPNPKVLKMLWNEQGIYIGYMEKGKPSSKAGDLWAKSDHLEFFISPGRGKNEYMHFAIDPTNDTHEGARRLKPIEAAYDGKWKCPGFVAKSTMTADSWSCEMFVPFAGLKTEPPKPYKSWFFNVVASDRRNGESYGFSLTMGNNHNINLFGLMKFMGEGD